MYCVSVIKCHAPNNGTLCTFKQAALATITADLDRFITRDNFISQFGAKSWPPVEDVQLKAAVEELGEQSWERIATCLFEKRIFCTAQQCSARWKILTKPKQTRKRKNATLNKQNSTQPKKQKTTKKTAAVARKRTSTAGNKQKLTQPKNSKVNQTKQHPIRTVRREINYEEADSDAETPEK